MSFVLRIMPPKAPPVEYALDLDRIHLGRSDSTDIVVKTPQVSSRHLEFKREGESFQVIDLDSTNGTKINGKEVDEALLADGDDLLIGNQVAALFSVRQEVKEKEAEVKVEKTPVVAVAVPESSPGPAKPRPAPAIPVSAPRKPAPAVAKPSAMPAAKP